jgi:hypothetical protein
MGYSLLIDGDVAVLMLQRMMKKMNWMVKKDLKTALFDCWSNDIQDY